MQTISKFLNNTEISKTSVMRIKTLFMNYTGDTYNYTNNNNNHKAIQSFVLLFNNTQKKHSTKFINFNIIILKWVKLIIIKMLLLIEDDDRFIIIKALL